MHSIKIQLSFQIFNILRTNKKIYNLLKQLILILCFLFIYIQLRDTHIFVKNYLLNKIKTLSFLKRICSQFCEGINSIQCCL